MQVLDAATLHPKLEVIQIVQCLSDYFEALEYITYRAEQPLTNSNSSFTRNKNELLEYQEHER